MSRCPNCGLSLVRMANAFGQYHACGQCKGILVSMAILRKAAAPEFVTTVWRNSQFGGYGSGGACPHCRRAMKRGPIDTAQPDNAASVCSACQCVWFEAGQLESAPTPPPVAAPDDELPPEAKEALAMFKVNQLAEQARRMDKDDDLPDEHWKTAAAFFGLPVEHAAPEVETRPYITYSLLIGMAALSLLALTDLNGMIERFGLIPAQAFRDGGLTFVSSFFLHGGILHLLGNLYFLWLFGDNVEDRIGPTKFLGLVALAAVGGDLLHMVAEPRSNIPCVGASGGISGVMAFYALSFPNARIGLMYRYFLYFRYFTMPAWGAMALWLGLQGLLAWMQVGGFSSVSALAHIGGVIVGAALWLTWRKSLPVSV